VSILIDPDNQASPESGLKTSLFEGEGVARRATGAAQSLAVTSEPVREWRSELATRVRAHRTRRYGAASLPLEFESLEEETRETSALPQAVIAEIVEDFEESFERAVSAEAEVADATEMWEAGPVTGQASFSQNAAGRAEARRVEANRIEEETKIIEFPRSPEVEESIRQVRITEELAEPVLPEPRILDVPEPVMEMATPVASVHLDEHVAAPEWTPAAPEFELPPNAAPLKSRFLAALMDTVLVAIAFAIFFAVTFSFGHVALHGKSAIMVLAGVPALFWLAYHYSFLVYAGMTPGMEFEQLELAGFDGGSPDRRVRAARAISLLVSAVSLGMGFAWSFIDPDGLGWHDRISRTYLRGM